MEEGDIALIILSGQLTPFYPQDKEAKPLEQNPLAPFFTIWGDSIIANHFVSVVWSMVFVALMDTYGRALFNRRDGGGTDHIPVGVSRFRTAGLHEINSPNFCRADNKTLGV